MLYGYETYAMGVEAVDYDLLASTGGWNLNPDGKGPDKFKKCAATDITLSYQCDQKRDASIVCCNLPVFVRGKKYSEETRSFCLSNGGKEEDKPNCTAPSVTTPPPTDPSNTPDSSTVVETSPPPTDQSAAMFTEDLWQKIYQPLINVIAAPSPDPTGI
jgi:hypothetical protein